MRTIRIISAELMKLIFCRFRLSLTMGLTRCYKTEGFFTFYLDTSPRQCLCALEFITIVSEFADTEKITIHLKNLSMYHPELKSVQFWYFWPKFGCHGSSLCFLENSDSIFEYTDPENPTSHSKRFSLSRTELKLVQLCLIFA